MKITVLTAARKVQFLTIDSTDTVGDLKRIIYNTGPREPKNDIFLVFNELMLDDRATLGAYGIREGNCVRCEHKKC